MAYSVEQRMAQGIGMVCDYVCYDRSYERYLKCKQWCAKVLRDIVEKLRNEASRMTVW